MARQIGTVVENNFIKGLITESTALAFPEKACTDASNVVFDIEGSVSKRLGIDLETGHRNVTTEILGEEAITEFVWKSVNGEASRTFFVQQKGRSIYVYDISGSSNISPNYFANPLSRFLLLDHQVDNSNYDPGQYPCQYTVGNGDLIVTNYACEPFYVKYDPLLSLLTATDIAVEIRDFRGLNDGLALTARPTSTVAGLISTNPAHYYNLLNQGWAATDALTQWDTATTDLPSNADYISLFRSSQTDAYDGTIVTSLTGYNTPAPKGHYILNAWEPDRTLGGTLTFSGTVNLPVYMDVTFSTKIGTLTSANLYNSFTNMGYTSAVQTATVTGQWAGVTIGTGREISKAVVYGSNNVGFAYWDRTTGGDTDDSSASGGVGGVASLTMKLYGKAGAAPASSTDGTLLGTRTFNDFPNFSHGMEILSGDTSTTYDHVWVTIDWNNGANFSSGGFSYDSRLAITEIEFYRVEETGIAASDDIVTVKRPTTCEFFQGRIFYSGVEEQNLSSNVYFSQIAEKREQYGLCYQKNDPTSEDLPDLLADDGGVIKIPDAGVINKLFQVQQALLVLATNGVWIIQGSAGAPFLATDYEVRKISSSGTNSPLSVASYRGTPLWWGSEGIHTIKYEADYGSYIVQNITENTIQELVDDVGTLNKSFVKGTCDTVDSIVYWLYNDDAALTSTDYYRYPKILTLNMLTGAFAPFEVTGTPDIRGITWIQNNATVSVDSKIKLMVSTEVNAREQHTYAEITSDTYTDWVGYSNHVESVKNYSALTKFDDLTSNETAVYDGDFTHAAAAAGTKTTAQNYYFGYTNATAQNVTRVLVSGSTDAGYVAGANPSITIVLYGKTGAAPGSGTDGTILGSTGPFTDTTDQSPYTEVISLDHESTWDHVWIYVIQSGAAATMYLAEAEFYTKSTDATQIVEYDAGFTTGYRLDGKTQTRFQSNYVETFMDVIEDSSCFLQGIYDFTNASDSGRWSSAQQCYRVSQIAHRDVVHSRLKIRGSGKALQLKYYGEGGAPFRIIGWNIWVTMNASV
jgi:hypothetical protein